MVDSREQYLDALRAVQVTSSNARDVLATLTDVMAASIHEGRADLVEGLADDLRELWEKSDSVRAEIEAWLGARLKEMGRPKRFLERVGETAGAWELRASPEARATLWNERSNALRLLGRGRQALAISEAIPPLLTAPDSRSDQRVQIRNVAILQRELGELDRALTTLQGLLPGSIGEERVSILDSLSATYVELGRHAEALLCCDEASSIATTAFMRQKLSMTRFGILASLGRFEEAIPLLDQPFEDLDPWNLISYLHIWLLSLLNARETIPHATERSRRLLDILEQRSDQALARGNMLLYVGFLRALAPLAEEVGGADADKWWRKLEQASTEIGQPSSFALIRLAQAAYRSGDKAAGRQYLRRVPDALTSRVGGVLNLSAGVKAAANLRPALDDLGDLLMEPFSSPLGGIRAMFRSSEPRWEDLRLTAELARDAVGRARLMRRGIVKAGLDNPLKSGLGRDALIALAPRHGNLGVMEWIGGRRRLVLFVTRIPPNGDVRTSTVPLPDIDLHQLTRRVRARLTNWRPGRPGEPFDLPEWKRFEFWLSTFLGVKFTPGDHIVFIEHADFAGLPWHVAVADRVTASYAPGWSALLSLAARREHASEKPAPVGLAMVPRDREHPEVLAALRASVQRTETWAAATGRHCVRALGTSGDRAALEVIFSQTEVAKILCHGFVDPRDHEVAFALAHQGALPPASVGPATRPHLFSWRDCQNLPQTPRVVFSAACSTGSSHVAGLGEQLGLFAALRGSGTAAVVAPRWDAVASSVLPILDDVFERHIAKGESLGVAVHNAAMAAEQRERRWLARVLAIEGDWR